MQVSVEESGVIERKLTISVPSVEIDREVKSRLVTVARKARIPGFRPGKAPKKVIEQRYAPQVTHEVITDTINSSYREALGQENIIPAGLVSIDPTPYEPGKDLRYIATIELFPEISSPTLKGKSIEKPVCEVTPEDVDNTIEDIRKRHVDFVAKEGTSEEGDQITIDFEGKVDGKTFEGGSATDFAFILGSGQMLKEFDEGLRGAKVGEQKQIEFTFPENYGSEDVAGKDVVFNVTMKKVEAPVLPQLDDGFAERLGIKDGGLEKMKKEVEISLCRELSGRMRTTIRDRVMDALYAINNVEIPKALLEDEVDRAVKTVTDQLAAQGVKDQEIVGSKRDYRKNGNQGGRRQGAIKS